MAKIEIDGRHLDWVREHVVDVLQERGITIQDEVTTLVAFLLQHQSITPQEEQELLRRGDDLIQRGVIESLPYLPPSREIDVNSAVHILAEVGQLLKFPWGPTGRTRIRDVQGRSRLDSDLREGRLRSEKPKELGEGLGYAEGGGAAW